MKTIKISIFSFLIILISVSGAIGQSNWENKRMRATGIGYSNPYLPIEDRKKSALESAKRVALRNLYNKVKSLQLNSGETIEFIIIHNDSLAFKIHDVIRNFNIIDIHEIGYDTVEIEVEIALHDIVEAIYGHEKYHLYQNYPNPFNSSTTIKYIIWYDDHVRLDIYNVLGQRVRQLVNENRPAGENYVIWDGKDSSGNYLSSGVYFIVLMVREWKISVNKVLLIK